MFLMNFIYKYIDFNSDIIYDALFSVYIIFIEFHTCY